MEQIEVSVIIPVYNAAKVLPQCINSVLSQDFENFELILVNDASLDNSLEILEKFKEKDCRIKIINNEVNKGIEKTRLIGISAAKGNYIMFMDNDDWLCKGILRKVHKIIKETDVDYVQFGVNKVIDKLGLIKEKRKSISQNGLIKNPELFDKYYISNFAPSPFDRCIWGKLYKRSLIENADIKASGTVFDEDGYFHLMLWRHLSSIYVLKDIGYNYRWGGLTTSKKFHQNFIVGAYILYQIKKNEIENLNYYKAQPFLFSGMINVLRRHIYQMIGANMPQSEIFSEIESFFEKCYNDITKYYTENSYNDIFIKAFLDRNNKKMYDIVHEKYKKDFIKRKIHDFKRQLYFLISHL